MVIEDSTLFLMMSLLDEIKNCQIHVWPQVLLAIIPVCEIEKTLGVTVLRKKKGGTGTTHSYRIQM